MKRAVAEQVMATEEQIPYKNFVKQVQKLFEKNIDNLRLYQHIMHEIKHTKFDIKTVVLKIHDLFDGNDEMIESFNSLMVPRKKRRTDRADIQDSVDFVNKVRTRFRDNEHVYAQFLDVVMRSKTEGRSVGDIFPDVAALFRDHQDLLDGFRELVSYDETHQQEENKTKAHQQEKENSDWVGFKGLLSDDDDDNECETRQEQEENRYWVKSGIVWCKKVMSKLSSSDEYVNFLRCLYHYGRGDIDIDQTQLLDLLKSQIGMHSELMLDLDQFLEYCDSKGAKKPWGPSYTLLRPPENRAVVSEKEPELKELNDRFLCKANNRNFKGGRVLSQPERKKFEWEDRRHKLDLKLEKLRSVITHIEQWSVYQGKEKKGMNDFISILNIKCIEGVYGRQASAILEIMSEEGYPRETSNLVLARMREIEKEQCSVIKNFRCMPKTVE